MKQIVESAQGKQRIKIIKILLHIICGYSVYTFRILTERDIGLEYLSINILKKITNPLFLLLVVCFGILLNLFILPRLPDNNNLVKILNRFELFMWGIIIAVVLISSHSCASVY